MSLSHYFTKGILDIVLKGILDIDCLVIWMEININNKTFTCILFQSDELSAKLDSTHQFPCKWIEHGLKYVGFFLKPKSYHFEFGYGYKKN